MLEKFARFVTKRSKLVIITWILAVLVALPFAPQVFHVLQYEEAEMAPANIDSKVAQDFIEDHFGNVSNQGKTIIVLRSNDVLDNETKMIVFRIDEGMFNESHGGRIDAVVSMNSLYDSSKLYLVGFLQGVIAKYPSVVEKTNVSANAIFGLATHFRSLYENSSQTAYMIYGIPDVYNQTWAGIYEGEGGGSIDASDNMTYHTVMDKLESMSGDFDPIIQAMMNGWFISFTKAWNATASVPIISTNPVQRAQIAEAEAFGPFIKSISSYVSTEEIEFLNSVNTSFNLTTYEDFQAISMFSEPLVGKSIDSYQGGDPQNESDLAQEFLSTLYGLWNSRLSVPTESAYKEMVGAAVSSLAATSSQEMGQFIRSIYSGLGWSGWNNSSAINQFAANSIAGASHAEPWLIDRLTSLGPQASTGEIMELATETIDNSSISSFPIPFPQELISSFVSPNNSTMIISLTYTSPEGVTADGKTYVNLVRDVVRGSVRGTTITPYVTGSDPVASDMQTSLDNDLHVIEPVTIILVLVLIGLYFRSFVASSVPPLFIGLALGIAFALVFFIGTYFLGIHYSVITLMLTSMMGAGCDYCIFILSRYREERRSGREKDVAVLTALTWAGESIATSGATVIIGFGVLALGRFSMLQSMGVSLALGVAIALLAALTLLPATLIFAGDKMFWPSNLEVLNQRKKVGDGYFTRSAKFAIKHAKVIIILAVLISVPAIYLVGTLDTSYDFIKAMPETESKRGVDVITSDFGGGRMMPTYVALKMTGSLLIGDSFNTTELDAIEHVSSRIADLHTVKQVTSPTRPLGEPINYANLSGYSSEEASRLKASMLRMIGDDQKSVLIYVILTDEPFTEASIKSISALRQISCEVPQSEASIETMYVGGSTASVKDISDMVGTDFSTMEIVVVIGIFAVLLVVLGSVVNPLRSILTILLSISWTLALTMLVFQFFLDQPILWTLPMILLVICLGLGMDYDILLTTRIREEASKGMSNDNAIVHAVEKTGGIITACGIIMAVAFGSMMISEGALLRELGFALMFSILLDSIIVRIYLVPAIMSLLGKWNWWAPELIRRKKRIGQGKTGVPERDLGWLNPDATSKK